MKRSGPSPLRSAKLWAGVGLAAVAAAYILTRPNTGGEVNQGLYHRYARLYDRMFRPYTHKGRRRAIELLDLQPGEKLLIPGVGTGLDLPLLPKEVQVDGIDISPEMLRQAQFKPAPTRTSLHTMDAQALDFPDATFDAVLLNLILSVVPDGNAAFREAWRVLRSGGRLAVFDKFLPESGRLTAGRRLLGRILSAIGTDPNRRFGDIIFGVSEVILEKDEPVLLNGQYRAILLKKTGLSNSE